MLDVGKLRIPSSVWVVGLAYLGLLCLGVMSQDEVTEVTELEASNVTVNSNITGDPRNDYKYDPNLPHELIGYDLSTYPFYKRPPTEGHNFTCDGRLDGFYASIPHHCQVYYNCLFGQRYEFLCANYTMFDQVNFICNYASDVDCPSSELYYDRNEELYVEASTTTAAPPRQAPVFVDRPAAPRPRPLRTNRPKPRRPLVNRSKRPSSQQAAPVQAAPAPVQAAPARAQAPADYVYDDYAYDDYYYDEPVAVATTAAPVVRRRPNRPRFRQGGGGGLGGGSGGGRRRRLRNRGGAQAPRRRRVKTTTPAAPVYEYYDETDYYYQDPVEYVDEAPSPRNQAGRVRVESPSPRNQAGRVESRNQPRNEPVESPSPRNQAGRVNVDRSRVQVNEDEPLAETVQPKISAKKVAKKVVKKVVRQRPGSFRRPSFSKIQEEDPIVQPATEVDENKIAGSQLDGEREVALSNDTPQAAENALLDETEVVDQPRLSNSRRRPAGNRRDNSQGSQPRSSRPLRNPLLPRRTPVPVQVDLEESRAGLGFSNRGSVRRSRGAASYYLF